jgi:hypothetical protein
MHNTRLTRILAAATLLALGACDRETSGPSSITAAGKTLEPPPGDTTGRVSVSVPKNPGVDTSASDSVPHVVIVDHWPALQLQSPQSGTYASGTFHFKCTSADLEDGALDSVVWHSSLIGDFGIGTDFQATLPDGEHIILLSVTDSKGHRGTDTTHLKIEGPLTLRTSGQLDRMNYQYGDRASLTVKVVTEATPRAGVDILMDIVRLRTGKSVGHYTALTDAEGNANLGFDIEQSRFPEGAYRVDAKSQAQGYVGQSLQFRIAISEIDTTRVP